jgi:hypothetical protein
MGREKRENGKRREKTGRDKRGLSDLCVEKIICQQIQF